jgi:hypothetical protein
VERIAREKDEYLQETVAVMRSEMARLVPTICQQVCGGIGAGQHWVAKYLRFQASQYA